MRRDFEQRGPERWSHKSEMSRFGVGDRNDCQQSTVEGSTAGFVCVEIRRSAAVEDATTAGSCGSMPEHPRGWYRAEAWTEQ